MSSVTRTVSMSGGVCWTRLGSPTRPPCRLLSSSGPPRRLLSSSGPPCRLVSSYGPPCRHLSSSGPPCRLLSSSGPPRRLLSSSGPTCRLVSSSGPPYRLVSSSGPPCRLLSSSGPPRRILFFGSDHFAVESLKLLTSSRSSVGGTLESLEVVTLSGDVPVKRFAQQNQLPVHSWPPHDVEGRFDVGVVVSFGCLLPERLINKFPYGILNVHPSLLPRWRGPAPIFHTIMHGDTLTGVTIIQIRPHRFDVGPILNQELHQVPENCTADELGAALATKGAHLLIDTFTTLDERIAHRREQRQTGATFAPKIQTSMSWVVWEEQTCDHVDRLYRSIGSRIPLRTTWMGRTIKLLDFVGKCHISLSDEKRKPVPGSVSYQKESGTLAVCCKDGWVGFKAVLLKKRLTATDFYNGYLHLHTAGALFVSLKHEPGAPQRRENSTW